MKKLPGLRWWIVGLVALATTVNYIDRTALAVMWPQISEELGISKDEYANIVVAFTLAYAVSQSLSGRLYDVIGTRLGFIVSIGVWSAAAALHGVAKSAAGFMSFRVALGLGEAGNWPGAVKSNAEWFPIQERAFAQGIFNAGASVGAIISPLLTAFLYFQVGWRGAFLVLGGLGLLWIVPWVIINRTGPDKHPWMQESERNYVLSNQPKPTADDGPRASVLELLSTKRTWAVLASRFFLDPIWWLFVTWLPVYLAEKFGFDIEQIGLFAWMPYVGAAVGSLFGGAVAGALIRRGNSVKSARRISVTLGGSLMLPGLLLTAVANDAMLAIGLITVILFGFQMAISNIQTLPSDLFTGSSVGTVAGMGGTTAAIGVALTTKIVPWLTETSYHAFFFLGAGLVPLGVACVYVFAADASRGGPADAEGALAPGSS